MSDSQTILKLLSVLKQDEVVSSSELIERLVVSGIPNATARQILGRASKHKEIWRTERLKLQRNERLFARSGFVGNAEFIGRVHQVLIQNDRRGIVRCLEVLKDRKVLNWVDAIRLGSSGKPGRSSIATLSIDFSAQKHIETKGFSNAGKAFAGRFLGSSTNEVRDLEMADSGGS